MWVKFFKGILCQLFKCFVLFILLSCQMPGIYLQLLYGKDRNTAVFKNKKSDHTFDCLQMNGFRFKHLMKSGMSVNSILVFKLQTKERQI